MDIVDKLRKYGSGIESAAADEIERLRHNLQVTEQTKDSYADLAAERLGEIWRLRKERDELLAAAELLYSWAYNWDSEFMNDPDWINKDGPVIRETIARVKGAE